MGEAIRITRSVWSARSLLPLLELFMTIESGSKLRALQTLRESRHCTGKE